MRDAVSDANQHKAGRPLGAKDKRRTSIVAYLRRVEGTDLLGKLAKVADDESAPEEVRLEALRYAHAMFSLRVRQETIERLNADSQSTKGITNGRSFLRRQ